MARANSGCEVLEQNFLELDLPGGHFDGVFANAALFHVPSQELPRVLRELHATLETGRRAVQFEPARRLAKRAGTASATAPSTTGRPGSGHVSAAGFVELTHFYRPTDAPLEQQPWLASVWRKPIS